MTSVGNEVCWFSTCRSQGEVTIRLLRVCRYLILVGIGGLKNRGSHGYTRILGLLPILEGLLLTDEVDINLYEVRMVTLRYKLNISIRWSRCPLCHRHLLQALQLSRILRKPASRYRITRCLRLIAENASSLGLSERRSLVLLRWLSIGCGLSWRLSSPRWDHCALTGIATPFYFGHLLDLLAAHYEALLLLEVWLRWRKVLSTSEMSVRSGSCTGLLGEWTVEINWVVWERISGFIESRFIELSFFFFKIRLV